MPSRTHDSPWLSPSSPPCRGTHHAGSRPRCLPAPQAAAAASPALFSKLFPWPRLTPALGLSCSLLSSFSPEKSRNSADAEGAELIYAVGSPALLYRSPGSTFRVPRSHNHAPDGAGAIISPPFPSQQGTTSQLNAIQSRSRLLHRHPNSAGSSRGRWGIFFQVEKNLFPSPSSSFPSGKGFSRLEGPQQGCSGQRCLERECSGKGCSGRGRSGSGCSG